MTRKNVPIEKIILGTLATAGLMAALAFAPGAGPALKLFGVGKRKKYSKKYIQNTVSRMYQKGYIKFEYKNGKKHLRITKKGKERLERYHDGKSLAGKNFKWDGVWRIVIFDIPEKKKLQRDKIRYALKAAGFEKLQHSVWVCPYPCEEFIKLLKADERIGKNVLYVEAGHIEYDFPLRRLFDL